ncbi:MAG TPA: ABC transporter permease [Terriglobia bacterium]|nr:ABC transporter permease [Terriglobia bacterium]
MSGTARAWLDRVRRYFSRGQVNEDERDFSGELDAHLDMLTEENVRRGMSPEEAARQARIRLGTRTQLEETHRELRGLPSLESFLQDVRYALRMLRKSPGFTAVAIVTLALGIGATTAVFSLVNAVLLKPLPFPHAERIVFPWRLSPPGLNIGYDILPWARFDFLFFSRESKTIEDMSTFQSDTFTLTGSGEPVLLDGLRVSTEFFPALDVSPALGRTFTHEEDYPGHEHEVVLSDALWRERFGADSSVLGRTLELNGAPYTVIGVMPRGFAFPRANEMPDSFDFAPRCLLWVPIALNRGPLIPNEPYGLAVVGRLKPGVTVAQAQGEMNVLGKRLETYYTDRRVWFNSRVTSLPHQAAGDTRRPLLLILAAVGVVLLIACSNVASLLLTRSLARKRELSLRAALGASNSRLICQLLTESIVLAGVGGLAGILLAQAAIYLVKIFGPSSIPRLGETSLDIRVCAFALGVTLLTGILFGLAPAFAARHGSLVESLKEGGQRSGSSPLAQKARQFLVVSQVALALVLVIAAGLLTRTFYRLLTVDPGFRPAHVLTFKVSLSPLKYSDTPHIVSFYHEALRRLQAIPGIQSAGITEILPMGGAADGTRIRIAGRPAKSSVDVPVSNYAVISPGYFSAAGTPILRGRPFLESDTADSMPVTVISEDMAKEFWPGQDPLGKQVGPIDPKYPIATIVGIAGDIKHASLREPPIPEMFVPYTQKEWLPLLTMDILLRTTQDPVSVTSNAREAIHAIDSDIPIADVKSLTDIVSDSMTGPRFSMLLLGAFAALALLLATIGMYGVISYGVAQRTQEIGVRMALGAQRSDVLRMVVGNGIRLAAFGIGVGLVVAFAVTRLMRSFLYGVQATDALTFASVVILLVLIALLASYIPARRAMKVDPMVALRYE